LVRRLATVPDVTVEGVAAGLHAVIRLAEPGSVDLVLTEAARHDLALDDVGRHWYGPSHGESGLIVGYGTTPESRYAAALDVLARVVRAASGQNRVQALQR
jgi:GntR family transcriptional regulator/MocR family aminotransferase